MPFSGILLVTEAQTILDFVLLCNVISALHGSQGDHLTTTVSTNGHHFGTNVSSEVLANTEFTPTHVAISFYKKSIYFKVFFRFGD